MELSKEVWVAIATAISAVVVALFSNWDKLFSRSDTIKLRALGYRPTGVYETELRIYFEVSGMRTLLENMTIQLLEQYRMNLIQQYPEDAPKITEIFRVIAKETLTVDDAIRKLLPLYQKHFSMEQIQELNRFYSTDTMQQMVSKLQALAIEAAPLQFELIQENQEKINELIAHKMEAMAKRSLVSEVGT